MVSLNPLTQLFSAASAAVDEYLCTVGYGLVTLYIAFKVVGFVRGTVYHSARKDRLRKLKSSVGKVDAVKINQIQAENQRLKNAFNTGKTRSYEWRLEQLHNLKDLVSENRADIIAAVQKDHGKGHAQEVVVTEVNLVINEIAEAIHHLKQWMKPEMKYTTLGAQPALSYIHNDPVGTVLVMSPWNYPINLALVPLMGAIAGGNCCFLKVSRHSPHSAEVMCRLIPQYLDMACIACEGAGGAAYITELIKHQWDHIFFTGSVNVGQIIYEAASKHLTPCTLELGGKNPCIVDSTADIELAAKRIAWGKWFNCGQTCIGVDYVLAHEKIKKQLMESVKKYALQFYTDAPKSCPSYNRVISEAACKRLAGLLDGVKIYHGGDVDLSTKYISPTIIDEPPLSSEIMKDEIFGPVLPVLSVKSVDDALDFIKARPHPLALYMFSQDTMECDRVLDSTRSGAALTNDTLMHFSNGCLPFGGVGHSGIGAYHGRRTFSVFTYPRAVIRSIKVWWLDLPLRYPPYNDWLFPIIDMLTRTGL
eukprot:GFYU01005073.1.p1 GENE.GFYU01005073.1~~GFYU01005073.1.p1  ORF type:complete len:571 (+),score=152.62 GFYU01005073.1:112-1713(+)